MRTTAVSTGAPPAPLSVLARFVGIITSPHDTFRSVVAHPRWLGLLLLVSILVGVFAALPMTTEAGKEAALEAQVRQMEGLGFTVDDGRYENMRATIAFAPYTTGLFLFVFMPALTLVIAGILFGVFSAVMGGEASFKQQFAVVVHASVIICLQQIFTGPLNYFRGAVTSATNVAALLPTLDEASWPGRILALTDLFLVWYVLVLAIGLGVLYRRRTQPIAITLYGVYAGVVLVLAAVMNRLGDA
jgi:hypothetical protein